MTMKHRAISPSLPAHDWPDLALVVLLAGAIGCVYDPNQRCDDNQVLSPDGRQCMCVTGAAMTAHGCALCGANEVPGDGGCACAPGYTRPTPNAACQQAPSALGMACDTSSAPCTDPTYATCHVTTGTAGYCTNAGCATSADCTSGYACDTSAVPTYCKQPPVGAGLACQTNADCAGTEATYCDVMVTHQCHVQGCTLAPDNCFSGSECCDLTPFGIPLPICVQAGTCPT
jgi:hypothetical protein